MRLSALNKQLLFEDLRDTLGLYDLEIILNNDSDIKPAYLNDGGDHMYIKFRPFGWEPKREKALHPDELRKLRQATDKQPRTLVRPVLGVRFPSVSRGGKFYERA